MKKDIGNPCGAAETEQLAELMDLRDAVFRMKMENKYLRGQNKFLLDKNSIIETELEQLRQSRAYRLAREASEKLAGGKQFLSKLKNRSETKPQEPE